MGILIYLGDGLWILSLSIMAGASRQAWNRMTPDTMVPISFKPDGSPHVRARRRLALTLMPGVAFVVSLLLLLRPAQRLKVLGQQASLARGVGVGVQQPVLCRRLVDRKVWVLEHGLEARVCQQRGAALASVGPTRAPPLLG